MMQILKNFYHLAQAIVACVLYGFPGRSLAVIGVTGTDGKTTTSSLIYHILKENGKKVAMITTVGAYIGGEVYDVGFHVTTPSSFALQRYLKKAKDTGHEYVVLEVTSHALDQNRAWGIPFRVGVLSNISHEHLDYHGTYDRYLQAKAKLLKAASICILNKDDRSFPVIEPLVRSKEIVTYSVHNQAATVTPRTFPFRSPLLGEFNRSNCLAAIAAVWRLGFESEEVIRPLQSYRPPTGRQEIVYDKDFMVMIDFAHTPNAFAQMLPEIKKITKNRLIHVFGSAAKRDEFKRPVMGEESSKYADIIIITAEDPRNEPVEKISKEIASGVGGFVQANHSKFQLQGKKKYLFFIPDREEAIHFAIGLATSGDSVILTGKSHEKSMNYGHGEVPWDEFVIANEALAARKP